MLARYALTDELPDKSVGFQHCVLVDLSIFDVLGRLIQYHSQNKIKMDSKLLLEKINAHCKGTLMETLNIEYVAIDQNSMTAKMPVNKSVFQPDGVLHGGATLALAESVGSAAAQVLMGKAKAQIRGLEISGNHVKSVRSGYVWAKATVLHQGRTTQLWQVHVTDEQGDLVSVIKFTTMILNQG